MTAPARKKVWIALGMLMGWIAAAEAQGTTTVTFDDWPPYSFSQYYTESGVVLQVLSTNGNPPQSVMGRYPGGPGTADPSPFMDWVEDHGTNSGYVAISLLSGQPFGLVSVDLGQITAARTVQFVGHLTDNSSVSATYSFPDHGVGMETFLFGPPFSQGLTHVDVFSVSYAMDNLVATVPEPKAAALLVLALFARAGKGGLTRGSRQRRVRAPVSSRRSLARRA
jgi:hypothetical protein